MESDGQKIHGARQSPIAMQSKHKVFKTQDHYLLVMSITHKHKTLMQSRINRLRSTMAVAFVGPDSNVSTGCIYEGLGISRSTSPGITRVSVDLSVMLGVGCDDSAASEPTTTSSP